MAQGIASDGGAAGDGWRSAAKGWDSGRRHAAHGDVTRGARDRRVRRIVGHAVRHARRTGMPRLARRGTRRVGRGAPVRRRWHRRWPRQALRTETFVAWSRREDDTARHLLRIGTTTHAPRGARFRTWTNGECATPRPRVRHEWRDSMPTGASACATSDDERGRERDPARRVRPARVPAAAGSTAWPRRADGSSTAGPWPCSCTPRHCAGHSACFGATRGDSDAVLRFQGAERGR